MAQATADIITPAFPKPKRRAPRTRINKALHQRVEAAVEHLIALLDAVEPDPDLELEPGLEPDVDDEDGGDHEPSLGSFDRMTDQTKAWKSRDAWWNGNDVELDNADNEESDTGIGDNDGLLEQTGGAH